MAAPHQIPIADEMPSSGRARHEKHSASVNRAPPTKPAGVKVTSVWQRRGGGGGAEYGLPVLAQRRVGAVRRAEARRALHLHPEPYVERTRGCHDGCHANIHRIFGDLLLFIHPIVCNAIQQMSHPHSFLSTFHDPTPNPDNLQVGRHGTGGELRGMRDGLRSELRLSCPPAASERRGESPLFRTPAPPKWPAGPTKVARKSPNFAALALPLASGDLLASAQTLS